MMFFSLIKNNLLTLPILFFILGILISFSKSKIFSNLKTSVYVTLFLLFSIGFKGGISFIEYFSPRILFIITFLVIWGFVQPFVSYYILRKWTKIDQPTAAAIAACFGSVSVMTYVAGVTFLDKLDISYDGFVVIALAIMEVPAIISGLFLSKVFTNAQTPLKKVLAKSILNKTVLIIFGGMGVGAISTLLHWDTVSAVILIPFKPVLCFFLLTMGILVGKHRLGFREFSFSLIFFGLSMPIIGGAFGVYLSYLLGLNVGTGTLMSILTASASYIAVPAAMKIALPEAKEGIYLPLSLGITFPFNVMVGVPLYYQIATQLL